MPEIKNHKLIEKQQNAFDYNFSYQLSVFYLSSDFYKLHDFSKDKLTQSINKKMNK